MYVHIFYTMVELDLNKQNKKMKDGYYYGVGVNFDVKILSRIYIYIYIMF